VRQVESQREASLVGMASVFPGAAGHTC